MINQDEVALRLTRTPVMEMHELMYTYGNRIDESWWYIIRSSGAQTLLLSHGWERSTYIDACKVSVSISNIGPHLRYMCKQFVNAYE